MFKISKEFYFSAAHALFGLPDDHPCTRLHGHNYVVTVHLYKLFNDALIASRRDQRLKACAIGAVAVGLRPTRRESWQLVRDFSNPIIKHFKSGTALQ